MKFWRPASRLAAMFDLNDRGMGSVMRSPHVVLVIWGFLLFPIHGTIGRRVQITLK